MSQAPRRRILVVDDEPTIRDMLQAALETRSGRYEVIEAGDAAEAVAMAHSELPDLVLLDVSMPGQDGFWVCQTIKQDPATAHIPVIMLSAMTLDSDRERAFEMGADEYVIKPFSPRAVLDILDARFSSETA